MMRRLRARRAANERGAVMIEFALTAPILVLLVLGIFEFGNAWRQVGSIERAAQAGGRTVSSQANGRYADYEALRSIDAAGAGLSGMEITRVVIYRAQGDGTVPATCLSSSQAGLCNRYTGSVLRSASLAPFPGGSTASPSCAGGVDASWCPVSRTRTGNNPVRIGVHVTAEYTPVTGLLPGPTVEVTRYTVYQIEPCAQGQSSC